MQLAGIKRKGASDEYEHGNRNNLSADDNNRMRYYVNFWSNIIMVL